jgi:tRNA (mo5U34)-methyltransferase
MSTTISERIARVPRWRHQIELPGGVVTPGTQKTLAQLPTIGLPADLTGKSVIDIGCSDGFYSFECERRGASRVLAVDNFSSIYIDAPSGFHTAHEILSSRVEFLQSDLFDLDARVVGQFDLVLFLGVLYHLRHPLLGLERLVPLCNGQLIVETEVMQATTRRARLAEAIGGKQAVPYVMRFLPIEDNILDPTSCWVPSEACTESMLKSCGFCDVSTFSSIHGRGVFHAFTPARGDDVSWLLRIVAPSVVARVASSVVGRSIEAASVAEVLRAVSIQEFGRIRQEAAELQAKEMRRSGRS